MAAIRGSTESTSTYSSGVWSSAADRAEAVDRRHAELAVQEPSETPPACSSSVGLAERAEDLERARRERVGAAPAPGSRGRRSARRRDAVVRAEGADPLERAGEVGVVRRARRPRPRRASGTVFLTLAGAQPRQVAVMPGPGAVDVALDPQRLARQRHQRRCARARAPCRRARRGRPLQRARCRPCARARSRRSRARTRGRGGVGAAQALERCAGAPLRPSSSGTLVQLDAPCAARLGGAELRARAGATSSPPFMSATPGPRARPPSTVTGASGAVPAGRPCRGGRAARRGRARARASGDEVQAVGRRDELDLRARLAGPAREQPRARVVASGSPVGESIAQSSASRSRTCSPRRAGARHLAV